MSQQNRQWALPSKPGGGGARRRRNKNFSNTHIKKANSFSNARAMFESSKPKSNPIPKKNISSNDEYKKQSPKSQPQPQNNKPYKLDKYKITNVPEWFNKLSNITTETPVIEIGGDNTPVSESGEYELNVPILNNDKQETKNSLSVNNLDSCHSSDDSSTH